MLSKNSFKNVCIIGAGPAGSFTGYLLSRKGFNVTIIEKSSSDKRKVCGEYLCPQGVNLLKKHGLIDLIEKYNPIHGMKIVSPSEVSFLSFFPKDQIGNIGASVNRAIFDKDMRELATRNGCKIIRGATVSELEKRDSQWIVKTEEKEMLADLLIAADGINSSIAQKLRHKTEINTKRIALHVYTPIKDNKYYSRLGQMHILKDGSYVGINPITPEEVNLSIVCSKDLLKEMTTKEIINNAIRSSKELRSSFNELSEESQISVSGSLRNRNSHIAGEELAYVGDSAGFIDPLTGEGIFNALQGAEILSQSLIASPNEKGLVEYKNSRAKYFREKNILNKIFQIVIKYRFISELIASFLKDRQERADTFIGIIGNIYRPLEGIRKIIFNH